MTAEGTTLAEQSASTEKPASRLSDEVKVSWADDLWFVRDGRWLTMRRAAIIAVMTILAAPVSWLTVLAMSPQVKKSSVGVNAHTQIAEQVGHFVTPSDQPATDPLQLLRRESEPIAADLANVRNILDAPRPRLILVTPAEKPIERSVIDEIARICTLKTLSCVQLDLLTAGFSKVSHVLPHATVHIERNVEASNRPDGLYLYDAAGHLRWYCRASRLAATAQEFPVAVQGIVAESLWQKEWEPELAAARQAMPLVPTDVNPKSKSIPRHTTRGTIESGRLRLSSIDGEVTDAVNPAKGWTPLRSSWAVVDYPEKAGKRPTLLVFWATWCVPCVKEFPLIDRLHEQYRSKVLFVGLADEPDSPVARQRIADVLKPYGFRLHYLQRNSAVSRAVFNKADAPLPAFALFDENGVLVTTQIGSIADAHNAETLHTSLDQITAKQTKAAKN
jgi:thiol-disulfide isomerase/thioredoxin